MIIFAASNIHKLLNNEEDRICPITTLVYQLG
ncbi:hypothetical protein SAMN05444369_10535 [Capnocytophaga haemolytica]|uniref:Uncharacterized protein n=1 Tax=Capnocytophaga haemolytica TaxID=45243 RepID=A0AAX2GZ10_9FLAO|nr:hypothetical protein SAMN05444369_10535 [Capnocytophaga haemolytica]SNV12852.1 Uncharacterised protein [Capnocytophaga haemolytica]